LPFGVGKKNLVKKVNELTDFGAEEKISIDTDQHQLTPSPTHNTLG
jgi:hypothetical protein